MGQWAPSWFKDLDSGKQRSTSTEYSNLGSIILHSSETKYYQWKLEKKWFALCEPNEIITFDEDIRYLSENDVRSKHEVQEHGR